MVDGTLAPAPTPTLEDSLRAMEPALPAPPEQLLEPEELDDALSLADALDGALPPSLNEQRPSKTDKQIAAEDHAARMARGKAASDKREAGGKLTHEEVVDECYWYDPIGNGRRLRRSR